jgi:methylmalonyl-CoA mutase C-terminal domain/subunit
MAEKYRIVVAKPGLDGHDRGAKIVARALRDAGFEVIYTGLHQTPEQIVETAIQEDADAVGLSLHSGAHMTLFPKVVRMLRERGAEDILVFGGGIVPDADIAKLEAEGVERIFTPGATTTEIVEWLRGRLERAPTADPRTAWICTSTWARTCSAPRGSRHLWDASAGPRRRRPKRPARSAARRSSRFRCRSAGVARVAASSCAGHRRPPRPRPSA